MTGPAIGGNKKGAPPDERGAVVGLSGPCGYLPPGLRQPSFTVREHTG